jgi:hypothetical protein
MCRDGRHVNANKEAVPGLVQDLTRPWADVRRLSAEALSSSWHDKRRLAPS